MPPKLDPAAVRARLEVLRRSWTPMTAEEARQLMEPPQPRQTFTRAVAARLWELRALDELTRHLHSATVAGGAAEPRQEPENARRMMTAVQQGRA